MHPTTLFPRHARRRGTARPRLAIAGLVSTIVLISTGLTVAAGTTASGTPRTDPSLGYEATWTITAPDGTARDGDWMMVGDRFAISYAAVDGTPLTACHIKAAAWPEMIETQGAITEGRCGFEMVVPSLTGGNRELCLYAGRLMFTDGQTRTLTTSNGERTFGHACGHIWSQQRESLGFRVLEGGERQPFTSHPQVLSWDPRDWDPLYQPLRFGQAWHLDFPDWVAACHGPYLNGEWTTVLIAVGPTDGCLDWDLRLPGVLPATLPVGDAMTGDWDASIIIRYHDADLQHTKQTFIGARIPHEPSDGIFASSHPAVFPVDLATTRFVHVDDPWVPVFQVSGTAATICRMELLPDPRVVVTADVDLEGRCRFEMDAFSTVGERHQYFVHALDEQGDRVATFGGSITSIGDPPPPVVDPPISEGDGDTEVEASTDGIGYALEVSVAPDPDDGVGVMAPNGPYACSDIRYAAAFESGGTLDPATASCALRLGSYIATGRLVDAAGRVKTTERRFAVKPGAMAAGAAHSCAAVQGRLQCWGWNAAGQLGNGMTTDRHRPVLVRGLSGVISVATGGRHTCAIVVPTRSVACWGANGSGQLGDGTTIGRGTPAAVPGLSGVVELVAGRNHTCAALSNGNVRCWGANGSGQLGDGTARTRQVPVLVPGLSGVTSLAAGADHTCAASAAGAVRCWGANDAGQLGNGTTAGRRSPVAVSRIVSALAVTAGLRHTCALLTEGTVRCWGANGHGQLGDGSTLRRPRPVRVQGIAGASLVAAGSRHTCTARSGGELHCWGANGSGQLGNGSSAGSPIPLPVDGPTGARQLVAGGDHTCASIATGRAYCWGSNTSGELGDGTTVPRSLPSRIAAL